MSRQLKILIVEDVPNDAELALWELKRACIVVDARRVETAAEYRRELEEFKPDLILSDFTMPNFDGTEALAIARDHFPDIPFIFVSGSIGEEHAIRALKQGANDYVMKTNLIRLSSAVVRAIQEQRERTVRRDTEYALRASELRKSAIFESALDCIVTIVAQGRVIEFNPAAEKTFGYAREEVLGKELAELIIPAGMREAHRRGLKHYHATGEAPILSRRIEVSAMRKDGSEFPVELTVVPIRLPDQTLFSAHIRDITERKRAEMDLLESEERFRQVAENIRDVFWLTDPSKDEMLYISPTYEEIWGRSRQSLYAAPRAWAEAIHLDDRDRVLKAAQTRQMAGEYVEEYRIVRPDGTMRWIRDRAFPVTDKDGNVIRIAGIAEDTTERKEQEHRIARLSRIHTVLSGINSAIVRIRDRQELFKEACRIAVEHGGFRIGWIAMMDHASKTLVPVGQAGLPMDFGAGSDSSNRPVGLVPGGTAEVALREKRPAFDNDIERGLGEMGSELGPDTLSVRRAAIRQGAKAVIVLPLYVEGKTFGILTLYAPERNFFDDEEVKLLTELAGDISFGLEFIAKEEKVDFLAYYDTLTGLPNRSLFSERLSQYLHMDAKKTDLAAVVLMDVERFRMVNETQGRQTGDELLRLIARRLESSATTTRLSNPSRLMADVFAVVIRGARDVNELARLIEGGMKTCFGTPFVINGVEFRIVARAGISVYPTDGSDTESLLKNAEAGLKRAKQVKERFVFYAPEMTARVAEMLVLETKLRRAIELEQFVLHYQPKFDAATGKITGVEALIRWNDPDTGMVPPLQFIHILEETGMIFEVGRWALRQALVDQQRWRGKGLLVPRVAVNVSAQQLRDQHFVQDVQLALASQEGLKPALELEITESLLMEDIERNIVRLKALRDLGVTIAIDDFGTGYSSLNYLARLPMDTLKIDRSFVLGMSQSSESRTIVSAVISLAHSLGLKVVAEGVETGEQLNILRLLQCDEMQGFLLSPAVSPEMVDSFLSRRARRRSSRAFKKGT